MLINASESNTASRLSGKYSIDDSERQFDEWKKDLFRNRFSSVGAAAAAAAAANNASASTTATSTASTTNNSNGGGYSNDLYDRGYQRVGNARRINEFKENFMLDTAKFLRERAEFESLPPDDDDDDEKLEESKSEAESDSDDYESEDDEKENESENSDDTDATESDYETENDIDGDSSSRSSSSSRQPVVLGKCLPPPLPSTPRPPPDTAVSSILELTQIKKPDNANTAATVLLRSKRMDPYQGLSLSQPRPPTRLFTKASAEDFSKSVESLDKLPAAMVPPAKSPATADNHRPPSSCSNIDDTACNYCKKPISEKNPLLKMCIESWAYHRQCVKCFACDMMLREDNCFTRHFNSNVFFYCESHIQKEASRKLKTVKIKFIISSRFKSVENVKNLD